MLDIKAKYASIRQTKQMVVASNIWNAAVCDDPSSALITSTTPSVLYRVEYSFYSE